MLEKIEAIEPLEFKSLPDRTVGVEIEISNSATRLRRVWEATHDIKKVVDLLAWEFANNTMHEPETGFEF